MRRRSMAIRVAPVVACILLLIGAAEGAEIKVMISGGFSAAYRDLVPQFERTSKNTVVTSRGGSLIARRKLPINGARDSSNSSPSAWHR